LRGGADFLKECVWAEANFAGDCTVSEIGEYVMERRNRREGYGQDNNNTTNSFEHIFKTPHRTIQSAFRLVVVIPK
jgi:hypothetical protein